MMSHILSSVPVCSVCICDGLLLKQAALWQPGAAAGLTIQEEGRLSPTSQVVDLRVDWLCRFAIRSYHWGQEYSLRREWRARG